MKTWDEVKRTANSFLATDWPRYREINERFYDAVDEAEAVWVDFEARSGKEAIAQARRDGTIEDACPEYNEAQDRIREIHNEFPYWRKA